MAYSTSRRWALWTGLALFGLGYLCRPGVADADCPLTTGSAEIEGAHALPDGTTLDPTPSPYAQVQVWGYSGSGYFIWWSSDSVDYQLMFQAGDDGAGTYDLEKLEAQLCTTWSYGTALPACANAEGDAACAPGCVPVSGIAYIDLRRHCKEQKSSSEPCAEDTVGFLTMRADTIGHFAGTVSFTSSIEEGDFDDCSSGGSLFGTSGCSSTHW